MSIVPILQVTVWAIKHKPSGHFLLEFALNKRRSPSTHSEHGPIDHQTKQFPRLHLSRKSAQCVLDKWCAGKFYTYGDGDYGDYTVKKVPTRIKADMELVPVILTLEYAGDNFVRTADFGYAPDHSGKVIL